MYIIDLYAKTLPGIADGPGTVDETMEIIKTAYENGIRVFFADMGDDPEAGELALKDTKKRCSALYPDFFICRGGRFRWDIDPMHKLQDNTANTLSFGDYIFVDFPENISFDIMIDLLQEIKDMGYRPILAGVEKYKCLKNNISEIHTVLNEGVYLQTDAGSFFDERYAEWSETLVLQKKIHFVATGNSRNYYDSREIATAAALVNEKAGKKYADQIFYYNCISVMRNKII